MNLPRLRPARLAWVLLLLGSLPADAASRDNPSIAGPLLFSRERAEVALPSPDPGSTQGTLEEAARRFVALWSAADVNQLTRLLSTAGLRLDLGEGAHASVGARQAGAALRELHQSHRGVRTTVTRVAPIEGPPARGFAELEWQTASAGNEARTRAIFVAFVEEAGEWRVSEIRVLR